MTHSQVLFAVALWLLLGLLADKFCERLARKEGRRYEGKVQAACYLAGPIVIPLAFFWAFGKALLNMLRH